MTNGSSLISGYVDGTLSDAEVAELNAWITADPANAKLFAKHAILHQQLHGVLASERTLRIEQSRHSTRDTKGTSSADEFRQASRWMSDRLHPEAGRAPSNRWKLAVRASWAVAAVLVGVCGVLGWQHFRAAPAAAQEEDEIAVNNDPAFITGDVGAVWSNPADAQQRDLVKGKSLTVLAGYVEVTFAAGAKVVVEGPSTFTIDSSTAMTMASGKLAATVDGGGFVINTPSAKITDLGTEFGVMVRQNGGTSVEVFKGKVTMEEAAPSDTTSATTVPSAVHTLIAGDGGEIDAHVFTTIAKDSTAPFVRNLSTLVTSLDVVDLLCGGDGTTHRRGIGIDVLTGDAGPLKQVQRETGDDHYHRVTSVPVVDGCFIPDGTPGPIQVDSAGHTYKFPPTSNMSQGLLWAGGRPLDPYGNGLSSTVLGATDFSESGHGALFMYSNKGVTLDLTHVPRPATSGGLYEFRATVGNTYLKMMRLQRTFPKADVYVLVDGELRFKRVGYLAKSGPFTLKVPLKEGDHFLTLVTSDGGDTRKDDYIVWGDPTLQIMVSRDAKQSQKGTEPR